MTMIGSLMRSCEDRPAGTHLLETDPKILSPMASQSGVGTSKA